MTATTTSQQQPLRAGAGLKNRVARIGSELAQAFNAVIDAVSGDSPGPVELGRTLCIDKVLASRVLKAVRTDDPLAAAHFMPGPEPLRRLLRNASARDVDAKAIARAAAAVNDFEAIIRSEAGDRSSLDAIISTWLPQARRSFELRRKQAAFKAMSEIKGACTTLNLATVALHPAKDGRHIDLLWVIGSLGIQRLRPGAPVKYTSRRLAQDERPRRPTTLAGESLDDPQQLNGLRLDQFCSKPIADLDVHQLGDVVHYTLADNGFGPESSTDLVFAEVNLSEMDRFVPAGSDRRGYVFAEVNPPAKALLFDVFVHRDIYPQCDPELMIYDTVLDGVASVNDRTRDIDQYDLEESIDPLGCGLHNVALPDVPMYDTLARTVFSTIGWDADHFRGYRCRVEYPIYGSQVVMAFTPPTAPVH